MTIESVSWDKEHLHTLRNESEYDVWMEQFSIVENCNSYWAIPIKIQFQLGNVHVRIIIIEIYMHVMALAEIGENSMKMQNQVVPIFQQTIDDVFKVLKMKALYFDTHT